MCKRASNKCHVKCKVCPLGGSDPRFCGPQPDNSLCCKITVPQFSLVLIVPTHEGTSGWVDLGDNYLDTLLARTASRCWRTHILPLWFFILSSFFSDGWSLSSLNGSRPNLDTYSSMTAIWKNWFELPRAFTPTGWGKKPLFGTNFELWPNISLQRNMISTIRKKLVHLKRLCYMPHNFVNFGLETAENGWRFLPTP